MDRAIVLEAIVDLFQTWGSHTNLTAEEMADKICQRYAIFEAREEQARKANQVFFTSGKIRKGQRIASVKRHRMPKPLKVSDVELVRRSEAVKRAAPWEGPIGDNPFGNSGKGY